MKNTLLFLSDGLRLAYTSTKNRIISPKKYSGTTEKICRSIINDCFNRKKNYFMVSPNNFRQFYARDFGMCCESLLNLGYREEVKKTLIYAMDIYEKHGKITTQITPFGIPADFPSHTPESASYMLNSLLLFNDKQLIKKYSSFFSQIAEKIHKEDIDKETGLLRKDRHFSSIKDYALRQSDCYNNCLLGLFVNNLKKAGIKTALSKYNYRKIIDIYFLFKEKGEIYFLEDLSGKKVFATDANIFPFWTGIFSDKKEEDRAILQGIIKKIKKEKLDEPWPLKYTTKEDAPKKMHFANFFCPDYEKDNPWMHLGLCYMKTIKDIDKKSLSKYLKQYEALIRKYGTFYEVFDSDGRVFSRTFYKSDEAMIWCSIFLHLNLNYKK